MTEKDGIELAKVLIGIPGVLGAIFWGIKWVANDWYEKRVQIEKLKEQIADDEKKKTSRKIDELESVISIHQTALRNHADVMVRHEKQLDLAMGELQSYAQKTSFSIQEYARLTHERLKIVEKEYKTTQTDLGNGKVLIKDKK